MFFRLCCRAPRMTIFFRPMYHCLVLGGPLYTGQNGPSVTHQHSKRRGTRSRRAGQPPDGSAAAPAESGPRLAAAGIFTSPKDFLPGDSAHSVFAFSSLALVLSVHYLSASGGGKPRIPIGD